MGPGTVFGEMGLYTNLTRSATATTSTPCVVYRLSAAGLKAMQNKNPVLAAAVHQYIVSNMVQHVADANAKLREMHF